MVPCKIIGLLDVVSSEEPRWCRPFGSENDQSISGPTARRVFLDIGMLGIGCFDVLRPRLKPVRFAHVT
jgi:hypothetical protein